MGSSFHVFGWSIRVRCVCAKQLYLHSFSSSMLHDVVQKTDTRTRKTTHTTNPRDDDRSTCKTEEDTGETCSKTTWFVKPNSAGARGNFCRCQGDLNKPTVLISSIGFDQETLLVGTSTAKALASVHLPSSARWCGVVHASRLKSRWPSRFLEKYMVDTSVRVFMF